MVAMRSLEYEFQRPLVNGWMGKLDRAAESRKKWREVADECMMFYAKSAAAMWDPTYTRRFWRGVEAPRFRLSINKAFELVAIFGPNLFWDVPNRTVEPKKTLEIPPDLFQQDPQGQQIYEQLMARQRFEEATDRAVSYLMHAWLNYTPQEQPGGGLAGQSELAIVDALIKGRGVMFTRPYTFPGSGRTLTGAFREAPENLFIDPDFTTLADAKWIGLRHVDPHWSVERRFKLPANSLKGRASLESSWSYGESRGDPNASLHRVAGQTNDMIVWYEFFSKTGPGARLTGMDTPIKEHLEQVVGDYAYIAVSPNVPYPLNCPTEKLRTMTDDEVRRAFEWPSPLWADDRWPCQVLDFYPDPESAWPIPPLAPGLGELKFLNFLVPWLCNRIWTSSRDFWAVAGPHFEHYKKYIAEGADQIIVPTPAMVDDVRKAVTIIQQPETRADVWRIIEFVSEQFDKRVGLTDLAYGLNPGGTQSRTAEETSAKVRAMGVRPEHMQRKVVEWQSEIATVEAFLTRWFVDGESVYPRLGPIGKYLWERYIMMGDVERVVRQMQYSVSASSIRRPNRDRDIANYQQVMQYFVPTAQEYGQQTGNYAAYNWLKNKWAEYHDLDLSGADLETLQPDAQAQQLQQQQAEMEMAKIQADVQAKQLDMQAKQMELQGKQAQIGMTLEGKRAELELQAQGAQQEMAQDQAKHLMEMLQDRQKFKLDVAQQKELGVVKVQLARKAARAKPQSNGAKTATPSKA